MPRLREHVEKLIEKLEHYDPQMISAHVLLKTEKYLNVAEITVKAGHYEFYGEGSADDNMFSAVDLAVHRVENQLKKHREKMKGAKKKNPKAARAAEKASSGLGPAIVSSEAFSPKRMSEEEASAELDRSSQEFLIYRHERSKKVNVIFKRSDGQHGLLHPES
jgi:putative sigma-54 modulation protein